jgi:hypothetical protein
MHCLTVLVTRFSWPHPVWADRPPEAYQAWLDARLVLLDRYPAASLRNAYRKPDLWVILTGRHAPDLSAQIATAARVPGLETLLVPYAGQALVPTLAQALATRLTDHAALCTVRLDSDDALAADYFARLGIVLEQMAAPALPQVISFPGGSLYESKEDRFTFFSYPDNAFLALVEPAGPASALRTVFAHMHTELAQKIGQAQYLRSGGPMWCAVIHEGNLANHSLLAGHQTAFADSAALRRRFGLAAVGPG